jgi:hypothetical protein
MRGGYRLNTRRRGVQRIPLTDMRIDVHAHYWTDAYLDMLVDLGRSECSLPRHSCRTATTQLAPGPWRATSTTSTPRWRRRIRIASRVCGHPDAPHRRRYRRNRPFDRRIGHGRSDDEHFEWRRIPPRRRAAPCGACGTTPSAIATLRHCGARSNRSAPTASCWAPISDFPYEDGDTFVKAVAYIDDAAASPTQALAIRETNAMALFGIRD